ncbi:MAG: YybH family protein [Pseudonocardiaceae bacterium]
MTDEDAIRNMLAAYVATWHRNDMDAWGALFTKDSDFVTNTAVWWKSRDENVTGHKSIPTWVMAETPKYRSSVAEIVLPAADVALVHAQWEWPGFVDPVAGRPIECPLPQDNL